MVNNSININKTNSPLKPLNKRKQKTKKQQQQPRDMTLEIMSLA